MKFHSSETVIDLNNVDIKKMFVYSKNKEIASKYFIESKTDKLDK